MTVIIADENGIREIDDNGNVICQECNATNDSLDVRCRNCGQKIKQTELTYKQEDYLIEYGMENEREKRCVNTKR
jgi:ribosomal protein L40E